MNKKAQATVEYILMIVMLSTVILGLARFLTDYSDQKLSTAKEGWRDRFAGVSGGDNLRLKRSDFYSKPVNVGELDKYQGTPGQQRDQQQPEDPALLAQARPDGGQGGQGGQGGAGGAQTPAQQADAAGGAGAKQAGVGEGVGVGVGETGAKGETGEQEAARIRREEAAKKAADATKKDDKDATDIYDPDMSEEEKARQRLIKQIGIDDDLRKKDTKVSWFFNLSFWKYLIVFGSIFFFILILIRNRGRRN